MCVFEEAEVGCVSGGGWTAASSQWSAACEVGGGDGVVAHGGADTAPTASFPQALRDQTFFFSSLLARRPGSLFFSSFLGLRQPPVSPHPWLTGCGGGGGGGRGVGGRVLLPEEALFPSSPNKLATYDNKMNQSVSPGLALLVGVSVRCASRLRITNSHPLNGADCS